MTIEQTGTVDFVSIEADTGKALLTISDHLPWSVDEGRHLELLQGKLNAYLRFIESGELTSKFPDADGLAAVVNIVGKFPLSEQARFFLMQARQAIQDAGYELRFSLMQPH